jgi:hypothetical protein
MTELCFRGIRSEGAACIRKAMAKQDWFGLLKELTTETQRAQRRQRFHFFSVLSVSLW